MNLHRTILALLLAGCAPASGPSPAAAAEPATGAPLQVFIGTNILRAGAVTPAQLGSISNAIRSAGGPDTRVLEIPPLYGDAPDGTPNPQDPTDFIQSYIDKASAQYSPTEGRTRLVFPPITWSHRELILKPNVVYQATGETVFTPRFDSPSGMGDRSIWSTRRVRGIRVDATTGGFDSWLIPDPDQWYGLSGNMAFIGPGRFVLDVRNRRRTQPALLLNEVENFFVEHGVIEVRHGPNAVHWAIRLGGRNVYWDHPIVRNGLLTAQDGVHVTHGRGLVFRGGDIHSGDDSFAFGQEYAGGSNVGPDEPLSDVYVTGANCDSRRARAVICYTGLNYIGVVHTNAQRVRRVLVEGLTGTVAQDHQSGIWMGYFPKRDAIWRYDVTQPGRGYRDGTYTNLTVTGGGGSGARCAVRVVGGQVDRAWIYNDRTVTPPVFRVGTGYASDGTVDLSPIPGGSGAVVTARYTPVPNDRVEDIQVSFTGTIGGPSHDGESAYGISLEGCRRVDVRADLTVIENASKPQHRPLLITAAQDSRIQLTLRTPVSKGGVINPGVFPGQVVDGITLDGCRITGTPKLDAAVLKFLGTNGSIRITRSRFENIPPNRAAFLAPDVETGRSNHLGRLEISDSTFTSESPPPRNAFVLDLVNNGGPGGQIGEVILSANEVRNMRWNPPDLWNRSVKTWQLRDNAGYANQSR